MSAPSRATPISDAESVAAWRAVAAKAPAIGMRVRILQLAWMLLAVAGAVQTMAIVKYSLRHGFWLGVLDTSVHAIAIGLAFSGFSRDRWLTGSASDLLERRGARVARFTLLRRVLAVEAAALVAFAPLRTLLTGALLQWGWYATLSVAMFLICWAFERIVRAEWHEHQRLVAADPAEA